MLPRAYEQAPRYSAQARPFSRIRPSIREARRRARADWFGKSLGDDWVEVEPGIYQLLLQAIERKGRKAAQSFIHTVPKDGQWVNEFEGGLTFCGSYATKEEAVAAGRERAQQDNTEHVNDPASRPG